MFGFGIRLVVVVVWDLGSVNYPEVKLLTKSIVTMAARVTSFETRQLHLDE